MSFRHARRNIEESTRLHIKAYLDSRGWTDPLQANRPFQALGATTVVTEFVGLDGSREIAAGTSSPVVSVAIPGDARDADEEIGGPLASTPYDLFVSVIAEPALVGVLTEDIVDLLAGRTARPVIDFKNVALDTLVTDETLELQDVSSGRARSDRPDWMLITGTIVRTFTRSWA